MLYNSVWYCIIILQSAVAFAGRRGRLDVDIGERLRELDVEVVGALSLLRVALHHGPGGTFHLRLQSVWRQSATVQLLFTLPTTRNFPSLTHAPGEHSLQPAIQCSTLHSQECSLSHLTFSQQPPAPVQRNQSLLTSTLAMIEMYTSAQSTVNDFGAPSYNR